MKRTKIQKIILPRNWIFGGLSYINNNLKNIINCNKLNLTGSEEVKLDQARKLIEEVIKHKKESSEIIKKFIKITDGGN